MARFNLEISRTAEKQLRKLPADARRQVARAMVALGDEANPPGSRKLMGHVDVFRIRVGVFRIIYSVSKRRLVIIILKIGAHRTTCVPSRQLRRRRSPRARTSIRS